MGKKGAKKAAASAFAGLELHDGDESTAQAAEEAPPAKPAKKSKKKKIAASAFEDLDLDDEGGEAA